MYYVKSLMFPYINHLVLTDPGEIQVHYHYNDIQQKSLAYPDTLLPEDSESSKPSPYKPPSCLIQHPRLTF